jgi:hypothetical protein
MQRRLIPVLLAALVLASAPAARGANPTSQESGNPINDQGSSYHYRTYITRITPSVPGLSVEVLEFADRLLLRNNTGKTVTVYGYSGEPYARLQPGGATEQNTRSPAVYLNTNFYANVTVPPSANATAPPRWTVLDRTGQFEWHDHRIHWMSPVTPPQVKDKSKRTKIFSWTVPIAVGNQPGAIDGELFWVPSGSSAPTAAIAVFVALMVLALLSVFVVRRRRRGRAGAGTGTGAGTGPGVAGGNDAEDAGSRREAW